MQKGPNTINLIEKDQIDWYLSSILRNDHGKTLANMTVDPYQPPQNPNRGVEAESNIMYFIIEYRKSR